MHIFPPIGKKYAYFSPIDLKYTKLQKMSENFPPHYIIFQLGKKYKTKKGGGGKNMNFKFNIHPCICEDQPVWLHLISSYFTFDLNFEGVSFRLQIILYLSLVHLPSLYPSSHLST